MGEYIQRTGLVYDESMASHFHIWNEDFTEKPERFIKTIERCKEYGLIDRCHRIPSRFSTEAEMLSLHTKEHVEILKQTASMCKEDMEKLSQKYDYLYFHNDIWRNSRLALGCTLELVDHIMSGKVQNGMAIIRPPGHHAMENEFNGYCYLNNVAIAAKLAIEKYKVQRVLILDWDVHHGQGIQYSFYDDPRVLYISIHKYLYGEEWPYLRESDFDYIGEGQGRGFNINIPLNEIGCDNSSYMAIFFNIVLPIVYEYNPDLVLVSAGYDAALGCPEGEMEVTPACFAHFVNLLSPLAGGKLCLVLEGGYCIKTLAEGVALSLGALLGDPCPRIGHIGAPHKSVWETILNVIKVLRPYWNSLRYQGNMTSLSDPQYPELLYWPPKAGVKFYTHDKPDTFSLDQDCFNPEYHEVVAELKERVDKMIQDTTFHKAKHKVCVVYDEHMLLHKDNHNGGYEECPERIQDIYDALHKNSLWQRCLEVKGRMATDDELSLVHGVSYLQQFRRAMSLGEEALLQYQSSFKSVYLCKDSYTAASWAVGCTLSVVDSVMRGESQSGVAIVRPPGHHAEANLMMGFCVFNNVGIAVKYAQKTYGVKRILIVDWDIHHGNALQSQFYDDTSVLYVSLHRFDQGSFYPYGGEGYHKCVGGKKAQGFNVNIAWNDGSKGDGDYISAFHHLVLPLAYEFDPELVFVAAGFDAVQGDELHGGYSLTPAVYGHMTRSLMGFSEGKVILVLEGGYNLKSTSESMSVCVSSLLGDSLPQLPSIVPSQSGVLAVKSTMDALKNHWKSIPFSVDLPTEPQINDMKEKAAQVQNGMAIIRPPGHHAMENEFNGYCYLNNVAIAAKLAIEKYKVQRVLILDWDVHHGQGIQYSFYDDPRVLYISIHKYLYGEEWPYLRESDFDYIGEGQGRGFNINIPLNEIGCDNSSYMAIFFNIVLPIVYEYNPDLVLVSAGYDAALGCPEGEMEVTPACFAHFVNLLSPLAGGKLCLVLEGGYCIKTLAEGVALSLGALLGDPCPRIGHIGAPHKSVWETILNVIKVLRPYWNSLRYQGNMTSLSDPQYPELLYWPPKAGVKFYTHDKPDTFSLDQDCFNPEYHEVVAELKERVDKMIQDTTFHKAKHKVCVVYDEHMLLHKDNHNGGYEECPERIQDIYDALHKNSLWQRCLEVKGRMATDDELSLVHGVSYLQQFRRAMSLGEEALLQYQSSFKSVYLCKDSYTAASWAVGCTLSVVDSVMRGESQSGVAIVRPPGHHAEANLMMGFCVFNNVGIAVKYAQKTYGVKRILIVDWDIHHGNALQSQFYDDTSVLYVSLHRFDQGSFYPYGGEGYHKCVGGKKAQGFNVNIAWNDGSKGDGDYISAFHHLVLPLAYEFDPELVFVAAGFDAVQGDELHGGYSLTPAVYGHMTRSLMGFSEGKVILVLEGGYNLKSTSESMSVCVSSLLGDSLPQLPSIVPSQSGVLAVKSTMDALKNHWKSIPFSVDLPTEPQINDMKEKAAQE